MTRPTRRRIAYGLATVALLAGGVLVAAGCVGTGPGWWDEHGVWHPYAPAPGVHTYPAPTPPTVDTTSTAGGATVESGRSLPGPPNVLGSANYTARAPAAHGGSFANERISGTGTFAARGGPQAAVLYKTFPTTSGLRLTGTVSGSYPNGKGSAVGEKFVAVVVVRAPSGASICLQVTGTTSPHLWFGYGRVAVLGGTGSAAGLQGVGVFSSSELQRLPPKAGAIKPTFGVTFRQLSLGAARPLTPACRSAGATG